MKRSVFFFVLSICSLILILACSKQYIDVSGTWRHTSDWKGCGGGQKDTGTIIVAQQGREISTTNVELNHVFKGTIKDNVISYKGVRVRNASGAYLILKDWTLTISEDENTFEGTVN